MFPTVAKTLRFESMCTKRSLILDSAQYKISLRKRMRWLNNEIKKIMVGIFLVFELIDVSVLNDMKYFHSSVILYLNIFVQEIKHFTSGSLASNKLLKLIINFEQPDV